MTEPHVLMTGLVIGECARWHEGRLWFSDWGAQEIIAVDPAGGSEVMLRASLLPVLHRLAARRSPARGVRRRRAPAAPGSRRVAWSTTPT